jgi:hypothetical protein
VLGPPHRLAALVALLFVAGAGSSATAGSHTARDTNLVANPTFASGLTGWGSYNATLSLVSGFDDAKAAHVTARAASFALSAGRRQVARTVAGTTYAATAELRGTSGKTLCGQVREWSGQTLARSATQCVTGDGGWLALPTIWYPVRAAGHSLDFYVYEQNGAKGDSFDADVLSLSAKSAPPQPPPPPPPPVSGVGSGLPSSLPASTGPTYYVSPSGSDSAAGGATAPWRTIGHALAAVSPGSTVLVHAGTYADWLVASRSGTASSPITVAAYPGEHATVTGRLKIAASYLRFSGLDFEGRVANTSDVLVWVDGSHVELSANTFRNSWMSAIYVGEGGGGGSVPTDVQIVGNDIEGNGTHYNLDHGVYCGDCSGALIADNVIAGNKAAGIQLYPNAHGAVVTGNTIVGSGRFGIILGSDGSTTSSNNLIVDNIVADNAETGIRVYWGAAVGSANVARTNLVYGNPQGNLLSAGQGIAYRGNIQSDPLFAGSGSYRLSAASPAVGAGEAALATATSFDGATRTAPVNLGAY